MNTYRNDTGKFQKAYTFFYDKLVPRSGNAETPIGNLLRIVSKIYYRKFNDGDSYYELTNNEYGDAYFYPITTIKDIDKQLLYKLEGYLVDDYYEKCVDTMMKYIMLENSTPDTIWNPETNRLVKINGVTALKCLKMLDCKLTYSKPIY